MKAKLKIRSEQHPSLDEVLEKYGLQAERLFASEPLILVVEYQNPEVEKDLRECFDVLEIYVEQEDVEILK